MLYPASAAREPLPSAGAEEGARPEVPPPLPSTRADGEDRKIWVIHGKKYDLTEFVKHHPGGRWAITQGLMMDDCTELFESYHSLSPRAYKALARYEIKEEIQEEEAAPAQEPPPRFDWARTPFYDDLKAALRRHFTRPDGSRRSHKAPLWWWCWLGLGLLACLASYLSAVVYGSWIGMLLWPLFYWWSCGAALHDGNHFSLSKSPRINRALSFLGSLQSAVITWTFQHNVGHHVYPNLPERDPDIWHFYKGIRSLVPGYRAHPRQRWHRGFRGAGPLRMLALGAFAIFGISFFQDFAHAVREDKVQVVPIWWKSAWHKGLHTLSRLALVYAVFVLPFHFQPAWKAALFATLPVALFGWVFFFFSQSSHLQEECIDPLAELEGGAGGGTIEWAKLQAMSSHDYNPRSQLWSLLSIGTNNQSLHHLFPQVHPSHFPAFNDAYEAICEKHGVKRRKSETAFLAFARHIDWIRRVNAAPSPGAGEGAER